MSVLKSCQRNRVELTELLRQYLPPCGRRWISRFCSERFEEQKHFVTIQSIFVIHRLSQPSRCCMTIKSSSADYCRPFDGRAGYRALRRDAEGYVFTTTALTQVEQEGAAALRNIVGEDMLIENKAAIQAAAEATRQAPARG